MRVLRYPGGTEGEAAGASDREIGGRGPQIGFARTGRGEPGVAHQVLRYVRARPWIRSGRRSPRFFALAADSEVDFAPDLLRFLEAQRVRTDQLEPDGTKDTPVDRSKV